MMMEIIINEMVCGGLSLIMFIGKVLVGVAQYDWLLSGQPGFSSWKEVGFYIH